MKRMLLVVAALPLFAVSATSTPKGFTDNLDEAFAAAKSNGKYVLACFSGSDWCGWCRKLEQEVFSKSKFLGGVTNDFELVFIDTPNDQSLLSEHAKAENEKLTEKYKVRGFPTVLIFDSEGQVLTRTGYREGGAKKYVKHLMEIRAKGPQLRIEAQLREQHIAPFSKKITQIIYTDNFEKIRAQVEEFPENQREKKAKELIAPMLPDIISQIESALADFKAKEVPEMISKDKAKAIKQAEELISEFKKALETK